MISCFPDWLFSWEGYWFAIISAVAGVLIGIWLTEWRFARAEVILKNKRIRALLDSIRFNVNLIDIALSYTGESKGLSNFPLDGSALSSHISACVDDLPAELIKDLNWQRFQLDHIAFKILLANLTFSSSTADRISTSPLNLGDVSNHLRESKGKLVSLSEVIVISAAKN